MKKILLLMAFVLVGAYVYSQRRSSARFESMDNAEFATLIADTTVQLVDVRTPAEFAAGHIPEAKNIDVRGDNFDREVKATLSKERPVAVYCRSGARSKTAARRLAAMGYRVYELNTGFMNWNGQRTEPTE
ncbi:MAG: rhodanese-like domain-containing protein [Rikenellaceae bacterium]|nr:rhodanese-like domain-containing protein [Rikenellaceae bacterium]MBQ3255324.1 rhodanese-like domain-containing protein [Rikenellaceae bacterium]